MVALHFEILVAGKVMDILGESGLISGHLRPHCVLKRALSVFTSKVYSLTLNLPSCSAGKCRSFAY